MRDDKLQTDIMEYYSEMSRYELWDLFYTVSGNVIDNITVLVTILFAYLALSYIAGKKLSRFQVSSISAIYSAFVLFMIGGIYRDSNIASDIAYALIQKSTHRDGVILTIVLVLTWLLSILFKVQTRRAIVTTQTNQ